MKQHGGRLETSLPLARWRHYIARHPKIPAFLPRRLTARTDLASMRPKPTATSDVSDLPILYRDEYYLAVEKPAGLLVHRSAIDRHETHYALQHVRDQIGRRVYPVHRMDKPTSGVLLFGLDSEAARRMVAQFTQRAVRKAYLAVVRGHTPTEALIDHPLKEELDAASEADADANKPAQAAITAYRRLAIVELPYAVSRYASARYSLLEVTPRTGRKHQIRRHMKHVFHPVIGDTSHGDGRHNRFFRERLQCRRLLLAATRLEFTHPYSGEPVTIDAPLDAAFLAVVDQLDWRDALPRVRSKRLRR